MGQQVPTVDCSRSQLICRGLAVVQGHAAVQVNTHGVQSICETW